MNKDWYETDNWYAPAEDKPLPEEKKQSGKKPSALRSRAFSLIPVVVAAVPAHIYLQSAAHGSACYFAGIASGSVNTNTVTPSRLVTATSSSWLLSIFLTRYRPSPTPSLSILRERSDLWKRSKM